jgi:hypothetical protein
MIPVDWAAVRAFQERPENAKLGVLQGPRAVYAEFPEVEAWVKARTARHLERRLYGRAITEDPGDGP